MGDEKKKIDEAAPAKKRTLGEADVVVERRKGTGASGAVGGRTVTQKVIDPGAKSGHTGDPDA